MKDIAIHLTKVQFSVNHLLIGGIVTGCLLDHQYLVGAIVFIAGSAVCTGIGMYAKHHN